MSQPPQPRTPLLQQKVGCAQGCLAVVLSFAMLIGGVFAKEAIFGPPQQTQRDPPPLPAPQPTGITGAEMIAYLRATAPSAGGAVYGWTVDAVTACVEGDEAPRTAVAGAECFTRRAATAQQRAREIQALVVPASLGALHRELLAIVATEERALGQLAAAVTATARDADRRRGRTSWANAWAGEEPYNEALDRARHIDGASIEQTQGWIRQMNRECDRVLRCVNREPAFGTGPVQIRCIWRHAVDALSGETPEYSVFADSESSLPACDGTRAPCHDPPGGFPR